jgi:hypothetical protein
LNIKNENVIHELLDVIRNLRTTDSLIVAELDLYRNVEEAVVVGMDIVGNCGGEQRASIKINLHLG